MTSHPTRRRFISISAAAAGFALMPGRRSMAALTDHRWRGVALGAEAELVLHHENADAVKDLVGMCLAEVRRLEQVFSLYSPVSAVSVLNRDGRLDDPPPELLELLAQARTISERTGGAFDITVQPLWRLYADAVAISHVPDKAAIDAARRLVDYRAVEISPTSVAFARPGMAITLNGIAQGYITDAVATLLHRHGMTNVLVNMGEIRALGAHPDGRPWRIELDKQGHDPIHLRDRAVATSAGAGFTFGGDPAMHHLFDPSTGRSPDRWQSVSVIAARATIADALSTAFMSMHRTDASHVAAEFGCQVFAAPIEGALRSL